MVHCIRAFLLRTLPVIPNSSKWTKQGPAVDQLLGLYWVHGLLPKLISRAFAGMVAVTLDTTHDQAFLEEVEWRQVAGSRLKRSQAFVLDASTQPTLTVLALVKEGHRSLTCAFLKCAKRLQNPGRPPRLLNFVTPAFSPVHVVLQYDSMLLRGVGSRLGLLYFAHGYDSLQEWLTSESGRAYGEMLLRCLLCSSSWLYRRLEHEFGCFPWRLAQVADERLPEANRFVTAHLLETTAPCCVDQWFTARCKRMVGSAAELMTPRWQRAIAAWARSVRVSMARVEFMHGGNRAQCSNEMMWQTFNALFVNREYSRLCESRRALQGMVEGILGPALPGPLAAPPLPQVDAQPPVPLPQPLPPPPPASVAVAAFAPAAAQAPAAASAKAQAKANAKAKAKAAPLRAQSALLIFRNEILQRDGGSATSRESWAEIKRLFTALPPEQRAFYDARAASSKHIASLARQQLRQSQA